MPFKSEKQRKFLYANKPEIAEEWSRKYNEGGTVMFDKAQADRYLAHVAQTQGRDAAMALVDQYRDMLSPADMDAAMRIVNMNCGGMVGYNEGGKIEPLKDSTKGTFKAQATRMGKSVPAAARAILDAPEGRYSPEMRRKANFALNARGWSHKNAGGLLGDKPMYNEGGMLTNHPFQREGQQFDTVPAMLTPGEFVVDADSAHMFGEELEQINNWEPTPADMAEGGMDDQYLSEDEAVEIKRKFKDGTEIIVKSPEGSKTEVSGLLSSLTKTAKKEGYEPSRKGILNANTGVVVPGAIEDITQPGAALGLIGGAPAENPAIPAGILTPEQRSQAQSQQLAGAALSGLGSASGSVLTDIGTQSLGLDQKSRGIGVGPNKFAGTNYRTADGKTAKYVTEGKDAGKYWLPSEQIVITEQTHPQSFPVRPIASDKADNKAANDAYEGAENAYTGMRRIDDIVAQIQATDWSLEGAFGRAAEIFKSVFGFEGGVSVWKTQLRGFLMSEVVNNLPPGVASDKDIELARSGFPKENWDKSSLLSWLTGYRKMMMFNEVYAQAKGEYITETGSQSGFRSEWDASEGKKAVEAEISNFTYGAFGESPSINADVPTITSQEEYDALPSGSKYYDGTQNPATGPWVKS